MLFGWAAVAFQVIAVKSGSGRHMAMLTDTQIRGAILWTMVGFWPGILSFATPKIAVVALLVRILNPGVPHRIFLWTSTLLYWASLNVCIPVLLTTCDPAKGLWDVHITKKSCRNPWILIYYSMYAGAFSAAVDLYLAVYPATILFSLQMKLKKKIALSIALGIGSVASIVAIYKVTRLSELASPDFSYDIPPLSIWTSIEGSTLIIATCIPTLQPLLKIFRRHIRLQDHSSNSQQRGWYGSSRPNHKPDLATEPGPKPRVTRPQNELDGILNTQNKDMESQTNILGSWAVDCESGGQMTREGILKTEEVRITYTDKAKEVQQSKDHPAN